MPLCLALIWHLATVCFFVRDMRFERMSLAYGASGVPNSPNPVCACRDTAISAGSHIAGTSGEVLHFPSGYQEASVTVSFSTAKVNVTVVIFGEFTTMFRPSSRTNSSCPLKVTSLPPPFLLMMSRCPLGLTIFLLHGFRCRFMGLRSGELSTGLYIPARPPRDSNSDCTHFECVASACWARRSCACREISVSAGP